MESHPRVAVSKVMSPNPDVNFVTHVDNLMKAIQSKVPTPSSPIEPESPSPIMYSAPKPEHNHSHYPGQQALPPPQSPYPNTYYTNPLSPNSDAGTSKLVSEAGSPTPSAKNDKKAQKQKKRYECNVPGCYKAFYQKTHLEIHSRAHTGDKPFTCSEPGCGQRFSQHGNLKVGFLYPSLTTGYTDAEDA